MTQEDYAGTLWRAWRRVTAGISGDAAQPGTTMFRGIENPLKQRAPRLRLSDKPCCFCSAYAGFASAAPACRNFFPLRVCQINGGTVSGFS
jgi:hypothetical protein